MKLAQWLYTFSKVLRSILLISGFGIISSCKHTPTCGEYLLNAIAHEGWLIGGFKGVKRIITCY